MRTDLHKTTHSDIICNKKKYHTALHCMPELASPNKYNFSYM